MGSCLDILNVLLIRSFFLAFRGSNFQDSTCTRQLLYMWLRLCLFVVHAVARVALCRTCGCFCVSLLYMLLSRGTCCCAVFDSCVHAAAPSSVPVGTNLLVLSPLYAFTIIYSVVSSCLSVSRQSFMVSVGSSL